MTNPFRGIRGQVTVVVFAVTACLYSVLGSVGYLRIAQSGRDATRERVTEVVDQLESGLRAGGAGVRIVTPDGVEAAAVSPTTPITERPDDVTVVRSTTIGGSELLLVGRASQARLSQSMRSLWRVLWIGIPLAAVISAAMAGIATSHALRPVTAITELANAVGANDSETRVPAPETGDEIEYLARTVNEMLERIASGRQAQRQFSSDAAHELRTPLMAIQCELELASAGAADVDDGFLDRLGDLARRLGDRVDDLVLLSTLDEQPPLRLEPSSLRELVASEAKALAAGLRMEVLGDEGTVRCDRALVARAVRNLLANARRHARSAATATVGRDGDRVWLHVDDDGPGIAPDRCDSVFDRFARMDESRSADAGGAGLGLAIVAAVASSHGGGVRAGAGPLGGARLTLWLPAAPAGSRTGPRQ